MTESALPWLTVALSVITIAGAAINVVMSLRLAALQAKVQADNAKLEISLLKQFVRWKDDILQALNGKYVTATLVAEIRSNLGHDLQMVEARLTRVEERCEARGRSACHN
jgi:hypothetical protein